MTSSLTLPPCHLELRDTDKGKQEVFDPLRNRWVAFTPEENVRQHFIAYLTDCLGFPAGCIGNEISLILNNTRRRCDSVIYDDNARPLALIEYKAPEVPITPSTFNQILRYALIFKVDWIIVSNGINNFCAKIRPDNLPHLVFTRSIPAYQDMLLHRQSI